MSLAPDLRIVLRGGERPRAQRCSEGAVSSDRAAPRVSSDQLVAMRLATL